MTGCTTKKLSAIWSANVKVRNMMQDSFKVMLQLKFKKSSLPSLYAMTTY